MLENFYRLFLAPVNESWLFSLVHGESAESEHLSKLFIIEARLAPLEIEELNILAINEVTLILGKWMLWIEVHLCIDMVILLTWLDNTVFNEISS